MNKVGVVNRATSAVFASALVLALGTAPATAETADGGEASTTSQDADQPSDPTSAGAAGDSAEPDADPQAEAEEASPAGAGEDSEAGDGGTAGDESTVEPEEDADQEVSDPELDLVSAPEETAETTAPEAGASTHGRDAPEATDSADGAVESRGDDTPATDSAVTESEAEPDHESPSAVESVTETQSIEADAADAQDAAIAVSTLAVPTAAPTLSPIASFVTQVLSLIGLNPSLANAPAAPPVGNSLLLGLLGWIRREVQRTFFNGTPTALPVQLSETGAGVVTGKLGAVDPEGDPLRYRVIQQPTNGAVTIAADGTFTYTPKAAPTADYQETFRVSIRDVGLHLHLFGINGTGRIQVPVTVNVSVNQAPVITSESTKRLPGAATGLISGLVNVSDPNDNPLTYTVTGGPAKGAVVVDPTTGAFLYRPTAAARQAAGQSGATADAKTDSFIVTVSDGAASTSVTTVVDIAAPDNTVVDTVAVGGSPTALAFTRDGSRVIVAGQDGVVTVIDTATNEVTATIDVGNEPSAVAVSPDGTRAYVTNSGGGMVSVLSLLTNQVTDTIDVGNDPSSIVLTNDGAKAFVVNSNSDSISVVDTVTKAVVTIAVGDNPQAVALTPDGAKAYVTNFTGRTISVINAANNMVIATVTTSGNPSGVAISPDGKRVYVTDFADGVVRVIDTATDKTVAAIGVGDNPTGVTVSPDGTRLYVTNSADNTVSVIDTEVNAVWETIDVGNSPEAVVLSPNGTRAYVANSNSGTVSVISMVTAPDPASAILGSTRGFTVYNLSSKPVKLAYYETAERPEGNRPPVGTIIEPGRAQRFEVIYNFLRTTEVRPVFETIEGPQTFYYTWFGVGPFAGLTAFCKSSSSKECKPSGTSEGQNNAQVYLLDVPGTEIRYDNTEQAQQQAQVLNSLCYEGSLAECAFEPRRQIFTKTPVRAVGNPVINTTMNEQTYNISVSDTRSETDSVTVTVKVAITFIKDKVNGEISAAYGHTWTSTHTFTQGLTVKVPPGYESQVSAAQPVYRVYGDFTLKMGNTTWHLTNIYFDTPNPGGGEGAYYISEKPYVG